MITARLIQRPDDFDAIDAAYQCADMRCDPNHDPHPPRSFIVDHPWVFIAFDGEEVAGTAVVRHNDDEVLWLTVLHPDASAVWEALGDAIIAETGMRPWGRVRNPELRARLAHEQLVADPEEEEILRWRNV